MTTRTDLTRAVVLVALATFIACTAGIFVRATASGQTDVDEPEYLLTAQSIAADFDLDIANQLAAESWREFHSPGNILQQTELRDDGTALSPHDPLLPILLAIPTGLFGYVGAKLALALMAAALAALTLWVGVRRLALPVRPTAVVVGAASISSPLVVYGQQVYPEIVAALVVMVAIAALTGPLDRRGLIVLILACTALPWLAVKYAPVAAALAVCAVILLRRRHRALMGLVAAGVLMATIYLAAHRVIYGGWTVYASGDNFQSSGEFGVVGFTPDYAARTIRIAGLLIDADFGLIAWQPAFLALPAAILFVVRRHRHRLVLLLPLAIGWLTATYVALTMQGYWWPGRQLVVVVPLAVLCAAVLVDALPARARLGLGVAAIWGAIIYSTVVVAGWLGNTTWVFAPTQTSLHAPWGQVLPDLFVLAGVRAGNLTGQWILYAAWVALLVATAYGGWRLAAAGPLRRTARSSVRDDG